MQITFIGYRKALHETCYCHEHASEFLRDYRSRSHLGAGTACAMDQAVCMDLELIVFHRDGSQHEVFLREVNGTRGFCIQASTDEATGLLEAVTNRPDHALHAAMVKTISCLGGRIEAVCVERFSESRGAYIARLTIFTQRAYCLIGVGVSDALALAIHANAPFFTSERLVLPNEGEA